MRRNTLLETAGRSMHTAARVTLNQADDNHKWQEASADGFNSDSRTKIERLQTFGFTSVPLPRDEKKQAAASEEGGEGQKGNGPEGIALYLGGQRNHPIIIGVDDRRHRPHGLKPGENAQYDDQGQMTLLRRDGAYVLTTDDDQNQRAVSIRHVEKSKQPPPSKGSGQQQQDFKHAGERVNAEVKVTKNGIQFIIGGTIMGEVTAAGFCIGGAMSDSKKREVFRYKDFDDAGNTPDTHAKKGYAV